MKITEIDRKKGSYAAVRFDQATIDSITQYQKENDLPAALAPEKLHATVMYSTAFIGGYKEIGDIEPPWIGSFSHFEIFGSGEDNALVMIYQCEDQKARWQELRDMGATWEYPTYQAHVTLSYNVGDLDPAALPAYGGPIVIVNEYGEDLDLDWADNEK